ncbi:MAG: chromosome segregation protein SMC [Terriglobia bacterium]
MKLKRIQVQGFKSFADKVEMVFEENGMTAIVGPNGCGKSNISDAIAWVLGEQSAKSLRGGRMEDVIFNGTRARLPMGFAEVILTLVDPEVLKEANTAAQSPPESGTSSIPEDETDPFEEEIASPPEAVPAASSIAGGTGTAVLVRRKRRPKFQPKPGELVVSRRLFRSGESEYLLNGKIVRLRDVQDIFYGTGLGPDSYAIIEQGRVGLILSSKPSDRRAIIEEAAGITKFKTKRKLAESKLEQAKQNLLRVNDITEEVSRQLGSLKRQAAKARRYRELRDEFRELSRRLFRERGGVLAELLDRNQLQLDQASANYSAKHVEIEEQDTRYRETNGLILKIESHLTALRDQLATLNLEMERGQQRVHYQKEQLAELAARSQENDREIARLVEQEIQYQQEILSKQQVVEEAAQQFERIQQDFLSQNTGYQAIQFKVREMEAAQEAQQRRLLECVSQAATLRNQLEQLNELESRLEGQLGRLNQEAQESVAAKGRLLEERTVSEILEKEADEKLRVLKGEIARKSSSLLSLKEEATSTQQLLLEQKDQLNASSHRLKSLEELAAHHAYTSEAVRLLLAEAQQSEAALFQTPGILADLVEVESPYELVVEDFLKQEFEYILVESGDRVSQGIRLLKEKSAGRSTFLVYGESSNPETESAWQAQANAALQSDDTLVPLHKIVRLPATFERAIREGMFHLSQAFICSSYARAIELARRFPALIFLSPEGEVLRGRLITGGGKPSSGHFSLKREIRELTRKVSQLEKSSAGIEEKYAALQESIRTEEQQLAESKDRAQELEKDLFALDLRLKQILGEIETLEQRHRLAQLELQRTEGEKAQILERRFQYQSDIESATTLQREIETQISSHQEELKQLKEQATLESQNLGELRSELATFRERKQAAEVELSRLTTALADCRDRKVRLESQKTGWKDQSMEIQTSIEQIEQTLFNQAVQKASLDAEIRSEEVSLTEARSTQGVMDEALKRLRLELEELQGLRTAHEIERARLKSDHSHLEETCQTELGTALSELQQEAAPRLAEQEFNELNTQYLELKQKIEAMGPVNMMALEEFQECEQRFQFLTTQRQDLIDSIEDTTAAIREIDQVSREQFREAFTAINANFQETFRILFGGGHGEMKLLDESDELDSGIEIIAQPPGKRLQNVLLLSGGEKALTAIALLLAIFRFQPSPFCVLDEVDAPLDEVNTGRYAQMIKSMSFNTQFLLITHSKKTMEVCDTMYGVTMQEAGVSKVVSVQFH